MVSSSSASHPAARARQVPESARSDREIPGDALLSGQLATARRRAARARRAPNRRLPRLNENYGRELLELHTLGVDGGYTQPTSDRVARSFTGWTIRKPREATGFEFNDKMHDHGEKRVLGHRIQAGRGIEDGEEVLDILAGTLDRPVHRDEARAAIRLRTIRPASSSIAWRRPSCGPMAICATW